MLETYSLYKGKNHQSADSVQCFFKGNFLLYNESLELRERFERTVLKRYGGFFRLNPSNAPVQLKVRIYIVKASLSPIRDNGICNPFLSIKIGDRTFEDTANTRQNTTDPIFGWSAFIF